MPLSFVRVNVFQYVHNPTGWVDSFGLEKITFYHFTNEFGYKAITFPTLFGCES